MTAQDFREAAVIVRAAGSLARFTEPKRRAAELAEKLKALAARLEAEAKAAEPTTD